MLLGGVVVTSSVLGVSGLVLLFCARNQVGNCINFGRDRLSIGLRWRWSLGFSVWVNFCRGYLSWCCRSFGLSCLGGRRSRLKRLQRGRRLLRRLATDAGQKQRRKGQNMGARTLDLHRPL